MKFTIHTTTQAQPVGYVYANDEYGALEIVRTTWTPMEDGAAIDTSEATLRLRSFGHDYVAVGEPEPEPERVSLAALEVDSGAFMDLVETAWFNLMQGDLMVAGENPDRETREMVERLAAFGVESILQIADGLDQLDAEGEPLPDNYVSPEELARRVVAAVAVVIYGGK